MKRAALFAGVIAAVICGTTFAAVVGGSGAVTAHPVAFQFPLTSFGSGLAYESIQAGVDAAMYCAPDDRDGTTATPECGLNAIRHRGVGPFTDGTYFTNASALDVPFLYACAILRPTDLSNAPVLLVTGTASTDGMEMSITAAGAACITTNTAGASTSSCTGAGQVLANQTNLVCWGLWTGGSTLGLVKVNDNAVVSNAVDEPAVPSSTAALFGRGRTAGREFRGTVSEFVAREDYAVVGIFNGAWSSVSACTTPGPCLSNYLQMADPESPWLAALNGDNYVIGGNWCGDADCTAAARWDLTGAPVLTRERRHSWPALSWAQAGTVSRSNTSALYADGYAARHAGMGPFSSTNKFTLPAGNVLSMDTDKTVCLRFRANTCAGYQGLLGASTLGSTSGWQLTQFNGTCRIYATVFTPSAADLYSDYAQIGTTHALCLGKSGTTWAMRMDQGTVTSMNASVVVGSDIAILGYNASGAGFNGEIYEVFVTDTPATAGYITYLTDAAMRCVGPGNCFPRDANMRMHCNGDEYTGGALRCGVNTGAAWTTGGTVARTEPKTYQNALSNRTTRPGAGPYTDSNNFQLGTALAADPLDFSGSFSVSAVFDASSGGTVLSGGYDAGTSLGWRMTYVSGKVSCTVSSILTGAVSADSAAVIADGSPALGTCVWDSATSTVYAKANTAAAVSTGGALYSAATGAPAYIGRRETAGGALAGRVYEVLAVKRAFTEAELDRIHLRWAGLQSTVGPNVTLTHTMDQSGIVAGGKVWMRGANMFRSYEGYNGTSTDLPATPTTIPDTDRINLPAGRLVFGQHVNNFTSMSRTEATWGVTVTPNGALAPDGTMTATAVRELATTDDHEIYLSGGATIPSAYGVSASVFVRPVGSRSCMKVFHNAYRYAEGSGEHVGLDIDTASGTVAQTFRSSAAAAYAGYERLADGWYRIWFNAPTLNAGSHLSRYPNFGMRVQPGTPPCAYAPWAGNTSYGFDVWQPQAIVSTAGASPLYPLCKVGSTCTADTITVPMPNVPSGPSWINNGRYTQGFSAWDSYASGTPISVEENAEFSPWSGDQTVDKLTIPASTGATQYAMITMTLMAMQATHFRPSIKLRAASGSGSIWLRWHDGTSYRTHKCPVTTTWSHCVGPYTAVSDSYPFQIGWNRVAGIPSENHAAIVVYADEFQLDTNSVDGPQKYCPSRGGYYVACGPGGATARQTINRFRYSTQFENETAWTRTGVTVTPDAVPGPTAGTFGDVVTVNADGSGYKIEQSVGPFAQSAQRPSGFRYWVKAGTTTAAAFQFKVNGSVYGAMSARKLSGSGTLTYPGTAYVLVSGLSTETWTQIWVPWEELSSTETATAEIYPRGLTGQLAGDSIALASSQMEISVDPSPTPFTMGADCPSYATMGRCGPQQRWCIRVRDLVPGNGLWSQSGTRTLFDTPQLDSVANYNSFRASFTGSTLTFMVEDRDDYDVIATVSRAGLARNSKHTYTFCMNDGDPTIYEDSDFTPLAATVTSARTHVMGSGLFTVWPTPIYFGVSATGTNHWNGSMGSVEFNTTGDPRDFSWDARLP